MDIDRIREETIGCPDKIYLNSAGCSLPPSIILKKITEYLQAEEQLGGYTVEALRAAEINQLYSELATLLHCQAHNIAFAYSATDAYAKALSAINFKVGDCILTSDDDYLSNHIAFISLQKRFGIYIIRAKNLDNGDIDLANFEQLIQQHKPILVAITHIPTNSGLIQPAEEIGKICRAYDIWYLLDACQSVGQMDVDVSKIGCDFLNATGRKFLRGPRATGFLYVSDKVLNAGLEPLFIDRRGADWTEFEDYTVQKTAQRFESQEISAALIGLKEAVRYLNEIGITNIETYNRGLMKRLRANLRKIKHIQLLDKGSNLSSILTFQVEGQTLETVQNLLKQNNIGYTVSHKHYALIDFTKKNVNWAIRFSPHYFNTIEEIDKVSDILKKLKNR